MFADSEMVIFLAGLAGLLTGAAILYAGYLLGVREGRRRALAELELARMVSRRDRSPLD